MAATRPTPSARGYEALADDPAKHGRQAYTDLTLLERREEVNDAVYRLRGVGGVKAGQDEVTSLTCGQPGLDGFGVPHLSDQDDVGVLA